MSRLSERYIALLSFSPRSIEAGVMWVALLCGAPSLWRAALADNFAAVHYDAAGDQLVVTMVYRGTNPNHAFSLQWGECKAGQSDGVSEVTAEVLDSQWRDAARVTYSKTTRFELSGMPCRPANVTLRTAPRFIYTVSIPAASSARR